MSDLTPEQAAHFLGMDNAELERMRWMHCANCGTSAGTEHISQARGWVQLHYAGNTRIANCCSHDCAEALEPAHSDPRGPSFIWQPEQVPR